MKGILNGSRSKHPSEFGKPLWTARDHCSFDLPPPLMPPIVPRKPATDRTRKRSTVTCFDALLVRPLPVTAGVRLVLGANTRRMTDFALPQRGLPAETIRLTVVPWSAAAAGRTFIPIEKPFTRRAECHCESSELLAVVVIWMVVVFGKFTIFTVFFFWEWANQNEHWKRQPRHTVVFSGLISELFVVVGTDCWNEFIIYSSRRRIAVEHVKYSRFVCEGKAVEFFPNSEKWNCLGGRFTYGIA